MSVSTVVALALLFQTALPGRATPDTAAIGGVVLEAASGDPIAGAMIELTPRDDPLAAPYVTLSNVDGTFGLAGIAPGNYTLEVEEAGYVPAAFNPEWEPSMRLDSGQQLSGLRYEMVPTGAITGRVYDASGSPMPSATIEAYRLSYHAGGRVPTLVETATSNDLGDYRLFWLPPGTYLVRVTPSNFEGPGAREREVRSQEDPVGGRRIRSQIQWESFSQIAPRPAAADGDPIPTYAPLYFPGTIWKEEASGIELASGAEVGGVDIGIRRVPTTDIDGLIIDGETGQPARYAQIAISPRSAVAETVAYAPVDPSTGVFHMHHVVEGNYVLTARVGDRVGRVTIETGFTAAEDITIVAEPGLQLAGRIAIDARGSVPPERLTVRLLPDPRIPGSDDPEATVAPDGTFLFENVPRGRYQVEVDPLMRLPRLLPGPDPGPAGRRQSPSETAGNPGDAFVESVRMGENDLLNDGLVVDGIVDDTIEITIGTDAARISGAVTDSSRQPARARVALVPEPSLGHRMDLYRTVTAGPDGGFEIDGIPPGTYTLFAWRSVETEAWTNQSFLAPYEGMGIPVTLEQRESFEVTLPAIP